MLYITGDTHGKQRRWIDNILPVLHAGDILIICGDFGVSFWDGPYFSEETFYDYIEQQPYIVAFIDGNHDDHNKLNSYSVELWNGGKIHRLRKNLFHLIRGQVYNIENKTIFTFGGGYSLDKQYRKENYDWWSEEMPSDEEYEEAMNNLKAFDYNVDYIITHTVPLEFYDKLKSFNGGYLQKTDGEYKLNEFLSREIYNKVSCKHWFFGHLHLDVELDEKTTGLLNRIKEINSNKTIRQW